MHRQVRTVVSALAVVCLAAAGCGSAPVDRPTRRRASPTPRLTLPATPAPDLSGYPQVVAADYQVSDRYLAFATPDGLTCRIGPEIGCDGPIRGTPAPANEVVLNGTAPPVAVGVEPDGFHQTSQPRFVPVAGGAARRLPPRHKIVNQDLQCAVDTGAVTLCTRGSPPAGWFVLSPARSGIGPRIAGLPPKFPDPHDFVVDEPGQPHFSVGSGLICGVSGGALGCDGSLPGIPDADNEIYVDLPAHRTGMRRADKPRFTTLGTITRLPAWHRVDYTGTPFTTCVAGAEGGVACFAQLPDHPWGFVVTAHSAWTFGD